MGFRKEITMEGTESENIIMKDKTDGHGFDADSRAYMAGCLRYGLALLILLPLLYKGMGTDGAIASRLLFILLPVAVGFQAVFQIMDVFTSFFCALDLVLIAYSALTLGLTVPHIVLAVCVIAGIPTLSAAASLATGIWIVTELTGKLDILNYLGEYDVGWIILVLVFTVIYGMMRDRALWGRATEERAHIGRLIYNKLFVLMFLAGLAIYVLEKNGIWEAPALVHRFHFALTGAASFFAYGLLLIKDSRMTAEDMTE